MKNTYLLATGGESFIDSNVTNHLLGDNDVGVLYDGYLATPVNMDDLVQGVEHSSRRRRLPTNVGV